MREVAMTHAPIPPQSRYVLPSFVEVIDYRPEFRIIAIIPV